MDTTISAKKSFRGEDYFGKRPEMSQLRCPICGYDYIHLDKPIYMESHDNYEAMGEFVRGDVIKIPFWCEANHYGYFYFGFHKGMTFYWADEVKDETIKVEIYDAISRLR